MNFKCVSRNGSTYRRVTKPQARKLFDRGATLYILPNNVRFDNIWMCPAEINIANELSFDGAINAYHYYNCNQETGYHIYYYIKVEE